MAGVSLSLVVGENGILNKATSAVTQNKKAQLEEEVQLILADWQIDYLTNGTSYDGRSATTPSGAVVSCTGDSILVANGVETYMTSFNNGQVGELTGAGLGENSQAYKAMHPIVPTGFTHITGEWNTGYVIQEDTTKDEFVWIPVVSEASYARKSGSKNNHISAQGANDSGKDVTQYILGDKLGLSTILGTTITETQRSGETPANIPEAEVVNAVGGFYVSRYEIGIPGRVQDTATSETETAALERNQTVRDWGTNAGGKADNLGDSTWHTGWSNLRVVSKAGVEPVRNISQAQALGIANTWKTGTNYQSGLITGTEWDAMCNFIGWSKCDSDCTSWGNYRNSLSKAYTNIAISPAESGAWSSMTSWQRTEDENGTRNVFQTGKFESKDGVKTDVKNIFDVAGNVWELTTEAPVNSKNTEAGGHCVFRGGSTNVYTRYSSATNRDGYASVTGDGWDIGFRTVLYVK